MLINGNIDRNDAQYNTNAPFTGDTESLSINGTILPPCSIRSLKIYCDETVTPPVRLSRISRNSEGSVYTVHFTDGKSVTAAVWRLFKQQPAGLPEYVTNFLLSEDGDLRGHITFHRSLPETLKGLVRDMQSVSTGSGAFEVLPQCLTAYLKGVCRSLSVNGSVLHASTDICPANLVHSSVSDGVYSIGLMDEYAESVPCDGICSLRVDDVTAVNGKPTTGEDIARDPIWLGGKHLVIRSSVASNVRVVYNGKTTPNSIELRGVLDGQH